MSAYFLRSQAVSGHAERPEKKASLRSGFIPPVDVTESPSATGWRHNAVHPEILDYLTVMIERMSRGKGGHEQSGSCPAFPSHRLDKIRFVQSSYRLVTKRERIFQELYDLAFGFHVVRAFPIVNRVRRRLARDRGPDKVVGRGDVLQLFAEGAHTFVVAAGKVQLFRRKIKLILRHGFGRFDYFFLDKADLAIDR